MYSYTMERTTAPKKILIVGMVDSVHLARWICQFPPETHQIEVFPSTPNRKVHYLLRKHMQSFANVKIWPLAGKCSVILWIMNLLMAKTLLPRLLAYRVRKFNPDLVHAIEFQHAGYLVALAYGYADKRPKLIVTNYGSDIYWFQRFPSHLGKIRKLLSIADYYSAECERDVVLAKNLGFEGVVLPVIPNSGGLAETFLERRVMPPSQRTVIAVKGYEGWVGRASLAIEAIKLNPARFQGYNIVFYSCNRKTMRLAKQLRTITGLSIAVHGKKALSHEEMLILFSESLISIGISLSDGISTSMLEALAMGSYPVQTSTSCASEWFQSPFEGSLLDAFEVQRVHDAIVEAMDRARNVHLELWEKQRIATLNRIRFENIAKIARGFYLLN